MVLEVLKGNYERKGDQCFVKKHGSRNSKSRKKGRVFHTENDSEILNKSDNNDDFESVYDTMENIKGNDIAEVESQRSKQRQIQLEKKKKLTEMYENPKSSQYEMDEEEYYVEGSYENDLYDEENFVEDENAIEYKTYNSYANINADRCFSNSSVNVYANNKDRIPSKKKKGINEIGKKEKEPSNDINKSSKRHDDKDVHTRMNKYKSNKSEKKSNVDRKKKKRNSNTVVGERKYSNKSHEMHNTDHAKNQKESKTKSGNTKEMSSLEYVSNEEESYVDDEEDEEEEEEEEEDEDEDDEEEEEEDEEEEEEEEKDEEEEDEEEEEEEEDEDEEDEEEEADDDEEEEDDDDEEEEEEEEEDEEEKEDNVKEGEDGADDDDEDEEDDDDGEDEEDDDDDEEDDDDDEEEEYDDEEEEEEEIDENDDNVDDNDDEDDNEDNEEDSEDELEDGEEDDGCGGDKEMDKKINRNNKQEKKDKKKKKKKEKPNVYKARNKKGHPNKYYPNSKIKRDGEYCVEWDESKVVDSEKDDVNHKSVKPDKNKDVEYEGNRARRGRNSLKGDFKHEDTMRRKMSNKKSEEKNKEENGVYINKVENNRSSSTRTYYEKQDNRKNSRFGGTYKDRSYSHSSDNECRRVSIKSKGGLQSNRNEYEKSAWNEKEHDLSRRPQKRISRDADMEDKRKNNNIKVFLDKMKHKKGHESDEKREYINEYEDVHKRDKKETIKQKFTDLLHAGRIGQFFNRSKNFGSLLNQYGKKGTASYEDNIDEINGLRRKTSSVSKVKRREHALDYNGKNDGINRKKTDAFRDGAYSNPKRTMLEKDNNMNRGSFVYIDQENETTAATTNATARRSTSKRDAKGDYTSRYKDIEYEKNNTKRMNTYNDKNQGAYSTNRKGVEDNEVGYGNVNDRKISEARRGSFKRKDSFNSNNRDRCNSVKNKYSDRNYTPNMDRRRVLSENKKESYIRSSISSVQLNEKKIRSSSVRKKEKRKKQYTEEEEAIGKYREKERNRELDVEQEKDLGIKLEQRLARKMIENSEMNKQDEVDENFIVTPFYIKSKIDKVLKDNTIFERSAKATFQQFDIKNKNFLQFSDIESLIQKLCFNLELPPVDKNILSIVYKDYDSSKNNSMNYSDFRQMYWDLLQQIKKKYYPTKNFKIKRNCIINRRKLGGFDYSTIYNYLSFKKIIGRGAFGEVHLVEDNICKLYKVVKIIKKKNMKNIKVNEEINVLIYLDHPNIIKIFDVYEHVDCTYIVMELCEGGELMNRIKKSENRLSESYIKNIMFQILCAIAYMHSHNIAHKDLKPENILFKTKDDDTLKIIDFGLAELISKTEGVSKTAAGTVLYMAPEVFRKKFTIKCDIWSVGVIMYFLFMKSLPFYGTTYEEVKQSIFNDTVDYRKLKTRMSSSALHMLKIMLEKDYHKRPMATALLHHPWFQGYLEPIEITTNTLNNIKSYMKQSNIRNIIVNVMAHELSIINKQMKYINDLFCKIDSNHNGSLSHKEIYVVLSNAGLKKWDINRIVQALDISDRGNVTYTEFLAGCYRWKNIEGTFLKAAFNKIDKDEDGYISKSDIYALVRDKDIGSNDIDSFFSAVYSVKSNVIDKGKKIHKISFDDFEKYMLSTF